MAAIEQSTLTNTDQRTVAGFGDEWERFDQSQLNADESKKLFQLYFLGFPWDALPENPVGFDLGCGSGRWAKHVSARIGSGTLHCIDPSVALDVARRNLAGCTNCEFHSAAVDRIPLADNSMDFGYSLGVLHHVPDTAGGLKACTEKLKPGAPFLLYLYYAFDGRPGWFRAVWKASDILRRAICRLPHPARFAVSQIIALGIYLPLARGAKLAEKFGADVDDYPLSAYRDRTFYTMRTDALDRFGTSLEKRFTKTEIETMMANSGLVDVSFNAEGAWWCAIGYRSA